MAPSRRAWLASKPRFRCARKLATAAAGTKLPTRRQHDEGRHNDDGQHEHEHKDEDEDEDEVDEEAGERARGGAPLVTASSAATSRGVASSSARAGGGRMTSHARKA